MPVSYPTRHAESEQIFKIDNKREQHKLMDYCWRMNIQFSDRPSNAGGTLHCLLKNMTKAAFSRILVGVCGCFLCGLLDAQNLVVNGSFEGGTYVEAGTGNVLPNGWTLNGSDPSDTSHCNVDSAVDAPTALGPAEGSHYMRFQSTSSISKDCLYQFLNTVPGRQYTVSFWVAITSTSVGNVSGLDAVWNDSEPNPTHLGTNQMYFSPTNTGPVAYQFFSYNVTATTDFTLLQFHAIDYNGSILLDNVVVEAVTNPPPAAPSITVGSLANDQLSFTVSGSAGSNYVLEAANDLMAPNWIPLSTNSAPFTFTETRVDLYSQRYYRALVAP